VSTRLARSLAVLAVGGAAAVALPAFASGSKDGSSVAYEGTRVQVSAAAVVDFRRLARLDGLRKHVAGPLVPGTMPEPQEKAEPNVRITLPSPFAPPLAASEAASAAPSPSPTASFLAQADAPRVGTTTTYIPPDTSGAVGRDKLMVPLNSNYVIQQKSDGAVLSTVSMTTFWGAVGGTHPFDPRVLYDPYNDRWLVAAVNDPELPSSSLLYGISDTSDPQGAWHLYALDADAANVTWADFPTIGFNGSTVAIGLNMFASIGGAYVQGKLIVLDYAALRGNTAGSPVAINAPNAFTIQPAVTYSPTEGTLYLVEHFGSASATYRFWSLAGPTAALTLVGGAPKANPLGAWSVPGAANVLPQSGGPGIDAGDARIGNVVFRNGHLFYAQTIGLPAGLPTGGETRSAVQWVELDAAGSFVQGGRIVDAAANGSNGGHWYAFPSIAVNAANDVLVGFSEFQSNDFPDAGYAFRGAGDPASTMRDTVTIKEGEGAYFKMFGGPRNRWGDYSSTVVDPSNDITLWTVQQYAGAPVGSGDGSGRWSTWWGKVGGSNTVLKPPCVVPKVTGLKLAPATKKIKSRNCKLGKVKKVKSTKKRKGVVVAQTPAAGKRLGSGAKIALSVGKGLRR
jgi:PASTA domain-containing protein